MRTKVAAGENSPLCRPQGCALSPSERSVTAHSYCRKGRSAAALQGSCKQDVTARGARVLLAAPCCVSGTLSGLTMLVRVLYAYSATAETELSVQPDERLTLIAGDSEGWVHVATLDGQSEGFVPANYVTLDEAADDDGSSVCSHGSFTTVAPSRAAQPNIVAAKALGTQLAGRLAAATSRDAQGTTPPASAGGLYEPFGDLKIDETQPSAAEEELVAPWDSVSCLGEESHVATSSSSSRRMPPARGLRLLPHDDGRPSPTKGGVRVVRPPTLQALLVAAHAKQAVLWPSAPPCVGITLYDEDGCEVSACASTVAPPSAGGLYV